MTIHEGLVLLDERAAAQMTGARVRPIQTGRAEPVRVDPLEQQRQNLIDQKQPGQAVIPVTEVVYYDARELGDREAQQYSKVVTVGWELVNTMPDDSTDHVSLSADNNLSQEMSW